MNKRLGKTAIRVVIAGIALASTHVAIAAIADEEKVVPAVVFRPSVETVQPLTLDRVAPTESPLAVAATAVDAAQVECIAKVVVHEAGNQPHRGQLAVAQVIRTRLRDGRFGDDACDVVRQRGQFFDVDAYNPPRHDGRWAKAVEIATLTLKGDGEEVASGALFFHAAGASMPRRIRVAQIADHVFYR